MTIFGVFLLCRGFGSRYGDTRNNFLLTLDISWAEFDTTVFGNIETSLAELDLVFIAACEG